jgi:DNA-binding CsgD family transcriptional regulator
MSAPLQPPDVVGDHATTDDVRLPPPRRTIYVSYRQYTILRAMLFDGASNKEIGHRLFIAEDTVKTHMRRVFARLRVRDRLAAAVMIWSGEVDVIYEPMGHRDGTDDRHLLDELRRLRSQYVRKEEWPKTVPPAPASPSPSPSSMWLLDGT